MQLVVPGDIVLLLLAFPVGIPRWSELNMAESLALTTAKQGILSALLLAASTNSGGVGSSTATARTIAIGNREL